MTSLYMYDSTVYCVENNLMNDSLRLEINHFFAHQHAAPGYLHGNAQTSFSWDLKHMELKGTDAGQGIPELTKTQRITAPSEWQII